MTDPAPALTLEIWSDVVCSWCYIGKRHLEQALERFPHRDQVEVHWRSFELDPTIAADAGTADEELARWRHRSAAGGPGPGVQEMSHVRVMCGREFRVRARHRKDPDKRAIH